MTADVEKVILRLRGSVRILPGMHLIVTVALVIGLVALLIIGFFSVAHDLLSRSIIEARSFSNEVGFEQIDRVSSHLKPRDQEITDVKSNC